MAQFHSSFHVLQVWLMSLPTRKTSYTIHWNQFEMQRFSYTGRQDEEFPQNGKYPQNMDFECWSFYITYKQFRQWYMLFFSLRNWLFTNNDSYFLQQTKLIKCVRDGNTQSHLLQRQL